MTEKKKPEAQRTDRSQEAVEKPLKTAAEPAKKTPTGGVTWGLPVAVAAIAILILILLVAL